MPNMGVCVWGGGGGDNHNRQYQDTIQSVLFGVFGISYVRHPHMDSLNSH